MVAASYTSSGCIQIEGAEARVHGVCHDFADVYRLFQLIMVQREPGRDQTRGLYSFQFVLPRSGIRRCPVQSAPSSHVASRRPLEAFGESLIGRRRSGSIVWEVCHRLRQLIVGLRMV